ncbi:WecB/TagA/CpsF family glycosyltransferase [Pontixanthobacter sp.]|uniref:WecB/TagA/CpsF family glycosyltransferase n=1 Tax=Pontixanthobacter sp. TaxID=2792078 RepID=UPI003C7E07EC
MKYAAIQSDLQFAAPLSFEQAVDGMLAWPNTVTLFGLPLVSGAKTEVAQHIVKAAAQRQNMVVNFVNAHCINTMRSDAAYAAALRASDLILPDGSGVRIAAKLADQPYHDNLNGTDLFPEICQEAALAGQSIFLLGGGSDVADTAGRNMRKSVPGLSVAGCADGYFSAAQEAALIDLINTSGAGILLIGLGVPKQELWIARNRHRITVPVIMGVGGLFDYYAGRIPRAPAPIRAIGCEWIWRLAMEPRRLANRYIAGNAVFLKHILAESWYQTKAKPFLSNGTKRALDIAVASLAIALLLPIIVAVAVAIKLEDRGPVLFRQFRIGENGRSFPMYKFRSMYTDAEKRRAALLKDSEREGICFKMRNDPRITKTGKFIRRFSIDELPQLFNVLLGHMSLVGPRPALGSEVSVYSKTAYRRLGGKPGITCIWQVSGRAEIPFQRQLAMDVAYLQRKGLATDVWLLARTIPAVLTGRGAY